MQGAQEMDIRVTSRSFFMLVIIHSFLFLSSPSSAQDNAMIIDVGSASRSGAYHLFVEKLKKIARSNGLSITNVSTQGSQENIQLLEDSRLDAALVQNDIAYYSYYDRKNPNHSFQTALPLFPEYFQIIVRKDAKILDLQSLSGKYIALGARGSGSYRNAKDILKAAEIPFLEVPVESLEDAFNKLRERKVDAIAYTGASLPPDLRASDSPFEVLPLPDRLIRKLTKQFPYFYNGYLQRSGRDAVSTVSLMAYLVLSNRIPSPAAEKLLATIFNNWSQLSEIKSYRLIPLEDLKQAVQRKPTPLHPAARRFLINKGYLFDPWTIAYYLMALGLITIFAQYISLHLTAKYDRLGNLPPVSSPWRYQLNIFMQGLLALIGIFAITALFYFIIMMVIRHYEENYAIANNLYNPFATMSIPDLMLWLWGWIGGYDNGIFPRSTAGKILVVFPPLLGIFSVILFAFSIWRDMVGRKLAEQRGTFVAPLSNHILICGWNEKARGIIFGLTTRYAPERKKIVVISELEDEKPLEKYNFPKGMVHYYRGDSSDSKALEAAHVSKAAAALILADERKKKAKNIGSVLTTLAIKRINPNIFTAAELRHKENIEKFEACRIDALVFAETVIYRLAAQSCFNPLAVSWLFDMITHDEHAELYALPVRRLLQRHPLRISWDLFKNKRTPFAFIKALQLFWNTRLSLRNSRAITQMDGNALASALLKQGIALDAIHHRHRKHSTKPLIDDVFSGERYTNFVCNHQPRTLTEDDVLIYAALEKEDIYTISFEDINAKEEDDPLPIDIEAYNKACRVLLIGELAKCEGIIDEMRHLPHIQYQIVTEDEAPSSIIDPKRRKTVEDIMAFDQWNSWLDDRIDVVIILADSTAALSHCPDHDRGESDAKTLITARRVADRYESPSKPLLVAEMLGRNSRDLFVGAGVDVVLPRSLLVERLMTKMAYGYGVVSNYLMAVLALNDRVFLNKITLTEQQHEWMGLRYAELYRRMPQGLHLLAISPTAQKLVDHLKNQYQDFDRHYLACPGQADRLGYRSTAGDVLLVLDGRSCRSGTPAGPSAESFNQGSG